MDVPSDPASNLNPGSGAMLLEAAYFSLPDFSFLLGTGKTTAAPASQD